MKNMNFWQKTFWRIGYEINFTSKREGEERISSGPHKKFTRFQKTSNKGQNYAKMLFPFRKKTVDP